MMSSLTSHSGAANVRGVGAQSKVASKKVSTASRIPGRASRGAGRPFAALAGAAGLLLTLTACWNAPEYLVLPPIPQPKAVVGIWANPGDGGRIDFGVDGTCRLTDIPEGALMLDAAGTDGKPTGPLVSTNDCTWSVDRDEPAIDLGVQKRATMIEVRGYDGTELAFYLGDPDQGEVYVLKKQPVH
jgi:hypothetical protein